MIEARALIASPTPSAAAVLRGVDLRISRGEYVAVLGRNGAGKTTLARACNALLLPRQGEMRIAGFDSREAAHCWEIRMAAGLIHANPELQIVGATVIEDTAFGPENLGLPASAIRERVDTALHAVALSCHGNRNPHFLSGGEKQRVALAGILAMQPQCIILDESTAMLDPVGQEDIWDLLQRLHHDEGLTIVLLTPDLKDAVRAERIVVLEEGRIVLDGPTGDIIANATALHELGYSLPPVAELFHQLREDGFDLPASVWRESEAAAALRALAAVKEC